MKVMFVCLGNICRSPLAHAVFDAKIKERGLEGRFETESSGTCSYHVGERSDGRMRKTASKRGVVIDHRARHFTASDFKEWDLILTMDSSNKRDVLSLSSSPEEAARVKMFREWDPVKGSLDVPDPYYGGAEGFEEVFDIVERTCDNLIDDLT